MLGIWVRGGGSCGHNGLDDAQGGGFFTLDGRIFDPISFELTGEAPVQAGVRLGVGGGFWGWGGHLGGGLLQSPPMSEKLTLSQVGPLGTWSTRRVRPGARRLGGVRCKEGTNLGDQDWPTG